MQYMPDQVIFACDLSLFKCGVHYPPHLKLTEAIILNSKSFTQKSQLV